MSINALSLGDLNYDDPWRRLYWTLPAAIAIWITILWSFSVFIGNSSERLPELAPVDAQIVEISEPVPSVSPSPEKQVLQPSFEKDPPPRTELSPVEKSAPISPQVETTPVQQVPVQVASNVTPYVSAKAISQPIPQIPEELRQEALSTAAVARFHVAPDGTTTAELVKPTPNPKLNRLLLSSLKNWRFFPAMKDGKPVASTEEIVIKIEVK